MIVLGAGDSGMMTASSQNLLLNSKSSRALVASSPLSPTSGSFYLDPSLVSEVSQLESNQLKDSPN
jgi:hypothetical protein